MSDRRTDGRTDRSPTSVSRVSRPAVLTRDKNVQKNWQFPTFNQSLNNYFYALFSNHCVILRADIHSHSVETMHAQAVSAHDLRI